MAIIFLENSFFYLIAHKLKLSIFFHKDGQFLPSNSHSANGFTWHSLHTYPTNYSFPKAYAIGFLYLYNHELQKANLHT